MKHFRCFLIIAAVQWGACTAAFSSAEPGSFLSWGAGARAMGLGNTYAGIADDVYATYWNPAGLGRIERKEIGTFHAVLWEDTAYSFAGYAHPVLGQGAFGASIVRLYSGGAEKRDENNVKTGTFDHQQMAIGLSYGCGITESIFWGVAGKYMDLRLDQQSLNGFTLDSGFAMNVTESFRIGTNIQNVFSGLSGDTNDVLPVVARVGMGYQIFSGRLLLALDAGRKFGATASDFYSFGIESTIRDIVRLRLGRNRDDITLGLGIALQEMDFDYALAMHYLGLSHRISLSYRFGATLSEQRMAMVKLPEEALPEISPEEIKSKEDQHQQFQEAFRAAMALYRKGSYLQALNKFAQAGKIDATDLEVPVYVERLTLVAQIFDEIAGAKKTSELLRRGITYFIEGNGEAAVKTVAYAQSLEQDNFEIERLLSRLQEKTGVKVRYVKPVSGISIIEQKHYEGVIAFQKREYSKVIDLCEEIILLEPRDVLAYKRLGSAFYALGEKDKALSAWGRALQLSPDDTKLRDMIQKLKENNQ